MAKLFVCERRLTTARRQKAAGWQDFPCKKQCFVCFASFVILIRATGYKPTRQSRMSAARSAK